MRERLSNETNPPIELSVVMPAYNEEKLIADAVKEVQDQILSLYAASQLIVVDDGSKDGTGAILDKLAAADARVKVIHQKNAGHGQALLAGMNSAQGEFLLLVDSDRQITMESFAPFKEQADQYDAILGVRRFRHDPPSRLVLTRIVRAILFACLGVNLRDANCPFKLVKRSVWQTAKTVITDDTLTPSLFLAVFLCQPGYKIKEQEVTHRERPAGVSTIRHWKLLKFCGAAFEQLLEFKKRLARDKIASK